MFKILMLVGHPTIKGPFPKILPPLVEALREKGCDVVTEPWGSRKGGESITEKIYWRFKDLFRIRRALKENKVQFLIVHTAHDWATLVRDIPLLWLCGDLCKIKVLQFHGGYPELLIGEGYTAFKMFSRQLLKLTNSAFVLSTEEKRQWSLFYPACDFRVVKNVFVPPVIEQKGGRNISEMVPAGIPVVLFVGRLIKTKGVLDLIEAVGKARNQVKFHLLLAGDGEDRPQVEKMVKALNLQNEVTFLGYLKGEELQNAYSTATIFTLPSWSEGFPQVLAEAMHAGLPIVTTPIRGALDYLKEGKNALFVPARDPEALADGLVKLLGNSELQSQMSRANRELVQCFASEIVGTEYFQTLKSLAQREAAPTSTIS